MERLAIDGGEPYRKSVFPARTPFGEQEVEMAAMAIRSQNLFRWPGHFVSEFERKFAEFYGVEHCISSTSGTAALHVAVGTIDPDPGDEIITSPITDMGTIAAILMQNAIPIFADIDPATYNIDPRDVELKITNRTRAIIPVHLFGNACDMDALTDVARRHNLPVIEDAAQAHATHYRGRLLGTIGDIGCFSLQQSKFITTGDGGMTVTNIEKYWDRMRFFVDKGFLRGGYGPRSYGFLAPNYRMTELTASVGIPQIAKVRNVVERRQRLGTLLTSLLADIPGVQGAAITPGSEHSYWLYPLRTLTFAAREFGEALKKEGIPCLPGYIGKPIYVCTDALANKETYGKSHFPFDSPYTDRTLDYSEGMCPIAEESIQQLVTISINENWTEQDVNDVAGAATKVSRGLARRASSALRA